MNENRSARADQIAAELRDRTPANGHTACDALNLCADCSAKVHEVRAIRHAERVEALRIPRPRIGN